VRVTYGSLIGLAKFREVTENLRVGCRIVAAHRGPDDGGPNFGARRTEAGDQDGHDRPVAGVRNRVTSCFKACRHGFPPGNQIVVSRYPICLIGNVGRKIAVGRSKNG
jgi:hypothetical protein